MKKSGIILAVAAVSVLAACAPKADKYAFQYVTFKETIPYTQGQEHPSCTFDLNVLKAHGTDTVLADAFNVDISDFLFSRRTTDVKGAMISYVDSVLKVRDTVWVHPYPVSSSAPLLDVAFPNHLGRCPEMKISAMVVGTQGEISS